MKNYLKNTLIFKDTVIFFDSLNNKNDVEKNNRLVNMINSGLKDLRKEIKEMSEKERKI